MARRRNRQVSTATRFKMSIAKQGSKNPMYGKHHKEQTKRKQREKMLEYWRGILP